MKRKLLVCLSVGSLIISAAMCVSFSIDRETYVAEAYTVSSLPTTINLNDSTTEEIQNYYSGLDVLTSDERRGDNLLKNLKTILKNGQKYYSYDTSDNKIWKIYEIVDRDWEKSPANEISSYNSTTNIISNYKYNNTNPYIHALYVNRNVENQTQAWGDHGQTQWGINREHIWPKSHGFDTNGSGGARGDLMHLWAGNGYANNIHSNDYFGYVDKSNISNNLGNKYSNLSGNYSGKSKTVGTGVVFEPQDSDKGDIARALFYMAARYNNIGKNDSSIDSDNPNLILNDVINTDTGTSSSSNAYALGVLSDLLEWNKIDPPDEWEIHRNNLLYKNFTSNRNPFIDYPEWANIIWGEAEGYANPKKANGIEGASGISLSLTNVKVELETTRVIVATAPDGVTMNWSVEDPTIATLSKATSVSGEEIVITPLKAGTTNIVVTATIDDEQVQATCRLRIPEKEEPATNNLPLPLPVLIAIGVGAVVLIVVLIIVLAKSKKARKVAKKVAKKQIKKATKSSSKKK